ncbi:MAG: MoaD/ThiS family protein [Candidatus Hydrogenedentales bacterium]|jgi:molybdopterin converting factor subunit 1
MTAGVEKRIRVRYFAILREQRGETEEELETDAATASDLYLKLADDYGFTLGLDRVRVVVNDEFREWNTSLADGDTVVFVPPVAGG